MKELLTASRMESMLTCPRKHYWSYEVCMKREKDADALAFGSAWHAAMEERWNGGDYDQCLAKALNTAKEKQVDEMACATLAGMLAGYFKAWEGKEISAKVHPEFEFNHPIKGSRLFDAGGKIDGLAELKDGRQAIIEHKTTGSPVDPDSDYWMKLRANSQIMQYVLAAREIGWNPSCIIYDVTKKPAMKPKNGEAAEAWAERLAANCAERPEFYFARREVPVLDDDLEEFEANRIEVARMIADRQRREKEENPYRAWPRHVGMSCGWCDYSRFCLNNVKVDIENPPSGFRIGGKHEELTQQEAT